MAWSFCSSRKVVLSACLSLFLISFSLKEGQALTGKQSDFHSVGISSILPSLTCKSSTSEGPSGNSSFKITNLNGACYKGKFDKQSLSQILSQDQSRVASILSRLNPNSEPNGIDDQKTRIPGMSGMSLGTGNYIVTIGLGTPTKPYNLIFDTGSDLTWTQCQPCLGSCYQQKDPIFNPFQSTTYSNISCSSPQCSLLISGTGHTPGCLGPTCVYAIQYGDQSFSVGFFSKDTITIGNDVFPNFLFGCGQDNQGLFGQADGLLGLGQNQISLVSQTAKRYGKVFSYCLPTLSGSNGYLNFGNGGYSSTVKFTPFSKPSPHFYFVDIVKITVGAKILNIPASVFQTAGGTIVDSGTVITRLPPAAYSALRSAFRQQMTKYKLTQAFSILDTCYDFTGVTTGTIPKIRFFFQGNASIDLGISGTFLVPSISQVCLAFAGNAQATDVAIFGNVQQQTLQVVYDVAGGKLGFGPGGCT